MVSLQAVQLKSAYKHISSDRMEDTQGQIGSLTLETSSRTSWRRSHPGAAEPRLLRGFVAEEGETREWQFSCHHSSRTDLVSTASMSLDAKQLSPLEKGRLPFTAAPNVKHHGLPPRSRFGSSLITVIKYTIPTIYLIYLLSRKFVFTVQRAPDLNVTSSPSSANYDDPASEFKDDVFPLRPHDTWDISTDFPYPRTLAYDVEEGTWLRLDVHPISGDIVFDMAGDIYCLSAHSYSEASLTSGVKTRAVPVLTGVPHDADPSFSPQGDRLAFRSDAGLGVDNIWVIPWAAGGCSEMDVRSPSAMTAEVVAQREHDAYMLAQGVRETEGRKLKRLSQEGRRAGVYLDNFNVNGSDPPCHLQPCASLMRPIIGSQTHVGTLREPNSLLRNGITPIGRWGRAKDGNTIFQPSKISSSTQ